MVFIYTYIKYCDVIKLFPWITMRHNLFIQNQTTFFFSKKSIFIKTNHATSDFFGSEPNLYKIHVTLFYLCGSKRHRSSVTTTYNPKIRLFVMFVEAKLSAELLFSYSMRSPPTTKQVLSYIVLFLRQTWVCVWFQYGNYSTAWGWHPLPHWGLNIMADILHTTFQLFFSWMQIVIVWLIIGRGWTIFEEVMVERDLNKFELKYILFKPISITTTHLVHICPFIYRHFMFQKLPPK